jgi:hypothetical protein
MLPAPSVVWLFGGPGWFSSQPFLLKAAVHMQSVESGTYEITTNGNVEDDVHGLRNECPPDGLVVDSRACHTVELLTVLRPDNSLLRPV